MSTYGAAECKQTRAVQSTDSITVYLFLLEDCVICQYYTIALKEMYQQYSSEHLAFKGIFPNQHSNKNTIQSFQEKYDIPFPLERDYYQDFTKQMGVTVTPTVVVYDEIKQEILYRGRIDDSYYRIGKRRTVTSTSELEDVLADISQGIDITLSETTPIGCFITFKD